MASANKEEPTKLELEDQFILRLPLEQAKIIHKLLKKKPKKIKKHLSIEFTDLRHAIVKVHRTFLHGIVVDLPTIIESNKTIDGVHLFKTADMCQMLLCQLINEEEKENESKKLCQYPHGLTPPLKNVKKRRFRKTLRNKDDAEEAADIEKEVLLLLRTDNEAVATRFEFINDDKMVSIGKHRSLEETEMTLFGERLSDIDSEKNSTGSASSASEINDLMDFTN
ncbi:transcription initiation factor tfiid 55 kd subunit-related [Holotrichia oblita]|uniref:Transcription initiation factor tfiid 55 kd subunit-related n=1 Tax=Holotrichia oblita TaxID=644536 RepID=A0ACB9SI23_HOLOL|nr:transcription initiation factor tfiid 55 kd subunit-related [Holotrichia oblita]